MKTHQVLNNKGETVKTFRYHDTYMSRRNAKERAEKLRNKLAVKYEEHFGLMLDCKSSEPWHKKAEIKY